MSNASGWSTPVLLDFGNAIDLWPMFSTVHTTKAVAVAITTIRAFATLTQPLVCTIITCLSRTQVVCTVPPIT